MMQTGRHFYLMGVFCAAFAAANEVLGSAQITTQVAFPVMGAIFVVGGGIIDAISKLRVSNVVNRVVVNRQDLDRR